MDIGVSTWACSDDLAVDDLAPPLGMFEGVAELERERLDDDLVT